MSAPARPMKHTATAMPAAPRAQPARASWLMLALASLALASCGGGGGGGGGGGAPTNTTPRPPADTGGAPVETGGGDQVQIMPPRVVGQADLMVEEPSASRTRLPSAGAFRLEVEVRNRGAREAAATRLIYYRSTDATIDADDTEISRVNLAALAAGGRRAAQLDVTVPADAGVYYYGACVTAVADESDEQNNCSLAAEIIVPSSDLPDLLVDVDVDNPNADADVPVRLTVQVENQGSLEAAATRLHWYRSTDEEIDETDTKFGESAVAALAAGGNVELTRRTPRPADAGTYYYGACVTAVAQEADTNNNCSEAHEGALVIVEAEPPAGPDLTVAYFDPDPYQGTAGSAVELRALVENNGQARAAASIVRFYKSRDGSANPNAADLLGERRLRAVRAGGSRTATWDVTAPTTAGEHIYFACVVLAADVDADNNCSSENFTVRLPLPDLALLNVSSAQFLSPGQTFRLVARLRNFGTARAAPSKVRFYWTQNDVRDTGKDNPAGALVNVPALGLDGRHQAWSNTLRALDPGVYYYYACVEPAGDELSDANDCAGLISLPVVAAAGNTPDVAIDIVLSNQDIVRAGSRVRVEVEASNKGARPSAATTLRYYLSSNRAFTPGADTEIGTVVLPALKSGDSVTKFTRLRLPEVLAPGYWYIGVCADAVAGETVTTNNCSRFGTGYTVR